MDRIIPFFRGLLPFPEDRPVSNTQLQGMVQEYLEKNPTQRNSLGKIKNKIVMFEAEDDGYDHVTLVDEERINVPTALHFPEKIESSDFLVRRKAELLEHLTYLQTRPMSRLHPDEKISQDDILTALEERLMQLLFIETDLSYKNQTVDGQLRISIHKKAHLFIFIHKKHFIDTKFEARLNMFFGNTLLRDEKNKFMSDGSSYWKMDPLYIKALFSEVGMKERFVIFVEKLNLEGTMHDQMHSSEKQMPLKGCMEIKGGTGRKERSSSTVESIGGSSTSERVSVGTPVSDVSGPYFPNEMRQRIGEVVRRNYQGSLSSQQDQDMDNHLSDTEVQEELIDFGAEE